MLVSVTLHRDKGRRLTKSEIAAPLLGDLEWTQHSDSTGRRMAHNVVFLFRVDGSMPYAQPMVRPLFDPRIEKIDGQTVVIAGTEMDSAGGRLVEHIQVWACTPVSPDAFERYTPRELHKPYHNPALGPRPSASGKA